jgi:hypothetical protein
MFTSDNIADEAHRRRTCPCPSVSVRVCPCLSVFVRVRPCSSVPHPILLIRHSFRYSLPNHPSPP